MVTYIIVILKKGEIITTKLCEIKIIISYNNDNLVLFLFLEKL